MGQTGRKDITVSSCGLLIEAGIELKKEERKRQQVRSAAFQGQSSDWETVWESWTQYSGGRSTAENVACPHLSLLISFDIIILCQHVC